MINYIGYLCQWELLASRVEGKKFDQLMEWTYNLKSTILIRVTQDQEKKYYLVVVWWEKRVRQKESHIGKHIQSKNKEDIL